MAEAQATQTKPDLAPEPIVDDGGQTAAPPADIPDAEYDKTAADPIVPKEQRYSNDLRQQIMEQGASRRAESMTGYSGEMSDPRVTYGTEADLNNLSEVEREALQRANQTAAANQPPPAEEPSATPSAEAPVNFAGMSPDQLQQKAIITVDGVRREVTIEEALRSYQTQDAAQNRFDTAKELLREVRELKATLPATAAAPAPMAMQPSETPEDEGPSNAELMERIQFGTTDEANEAMDLMIDRRLKQRGGNASPYDVLAVMDQRDAQARIEAFAEKNQDLIRDENSVTLVSNFAQKEMIKDLQKAGFSQEQLSTAIQNQDGLKTLHRMARVQGVPGMRSADQLLEAGKNQFLAWRNGGVTVQNQNSSSPHTTKMERKAGLPTQPAFNGKAPPASAQPQTVEQSRSSGFSEIAKFRGVL